MKLGHLVQLALMAFLVQWGLMVHLASKAPQALLEPLVLPAWQGPLGLLALRAALDLREFEDNWVIQEFQVSKEKLAQKENQGHMVFRVLLVHLEKKAKEVLEVTQAQLVLQGQWEKGVLLAIVVFQALMVYLDQRVLRESVVL